MKQLQLLMLTIVIVLSAMKSQEFNHFHL